MATTYDTNDEFQAALQATGACGNPYDYSDGVAGDDQKTEVAYCSDTASVRDLVEAHAGDAFPPVVTTHACDKCLIDVYPGHVWVVWVPAFCKPGTHCKPTCSSSCRVPWGG